MLDKKRKINKHRPDDRVGIQAAPCWQYTANAVTIVEWLCSDIDAVGLHCNRCSHQNMIVINALATNIVEIKLYQMTVANGLNMMLSNKFISLVVRKKKNDLRNMWKRIQCNERPENKCLNFQITTENASLVKQPINTENDPMSKEKNQTVNRFHFHTFLVMHRHTNHLLSIYRNWNRKRCTE